MRRQGLSPRTVLGYEGLLDSQILPTLGHIKLQDITAATLNRFYVKVENAPSKKTGRTISGTYAAKYHAALRTMLNCAVKWDYISTNPAYKADPPKPDTQEFKVYDDVQSLALLDALDSEPITWRTMMTLALFSQMRRGELIALNWSDVTGDVLHVTRNAVYTPEQGMILKSPKTAAGKRMISLPSPVVQCLKDLRIHQLQERMKLGETWADEDAVFTQWNGARMHIDTPTKWFSKFLDRHELPRIRLHDLRHTGASLLISQGLDVETVKQRLGHARASTTMNIYGHAYQKADRAASNLLENMLKNGQ